MRDNSAIIGTANGGGSPARTLPGTFAVDDGCLHGHRQPRCHPCIRLLRTKESSCREVSIGSSQR